MNRKIIAESLQKHFSLNKESRVLIVGLGVTGFSVVKFLQLQEITFAVVDSRDKPPFYEELIQSYPDVPVFINGFHQTAFDVATHIVVSPGVCLQEKEIQKAIDTDVKLVSDIDLFSCATEKPVVAITGSNGKSTVTTMLGAMGNAAGLTTEIGGNLGVPVLDLLNDSVELYVLELSSFQLERTHILNAVAATVLNISADHLDRHGDIGDYVKEKQRVFCGNGVMVINDDDSLVKKMKAENREILLFSVKKNVGFHIKNRHGVDWLMNADQLLMKKSELTVAGIHNVANALAAMALGTALGMKNELMCNTLRGFKGLDHRMQKVAQINGVTWVNDSKATNIGACLAALTSFRNKVILIAGGDAKGADMNELTLGVNENAKCVVLIGQDAGKIENAIKGYIPSYRANTIHDAVQIASKLAQEGESVLLSPACASTDQYENYQERGDKFTAAVMELAA